jgi:glycosyltransferase involved in cell wall biosynthesis
MQIAILLATYNGTPYLQEQLDSIKRQTHIDWTVLSSDDGSNDETMAMIDAFANTVGKS